MKHLQNLYGYFTGLIMILNTLFWGIPVMLVGSIKLASKNEKWRQFWSPPVVWLCTGWGYGCILLEKIFLPVRYHISYEGPSLSKQKSYLVLANHQSMTDIPVLMKSILPHVPFLRFFAKAELKKVPVFGFAWQAVDYPFMRRYSKEFLEKNPHLRGQDLEETIQSCRKLRHAPVAITNFVEGTRFTPEKHAKQGSQFTHLLSPRAGGVALALAALEGKLESLVDVTVYYHQDRHELLDYLSGRVREVTVIVKNMPIPFEFYGRDYQNDPAFRAQFQGWVNRMWQEKDELLKTLHSQKVK